MPPPRFAAAPSSSAAAAAWIVAPVARRARSTSCLRPRQPERELLAPRQLAASGRAPRYAVACVARSSRQLARRAGLRRRRRRAARAPSRTSRYFGEREAVTGRERVGRWTSCANARTVAPLAADAGGAAPRSTCAARARRVTTARSTCRPFASRADPPARSSTARPAPLRSVAIGAVPSKKRTERTATSSPRRRAATAGRSRTRPPSGDEPRGRRPRDDAERRSGGSPCSA